MGEVLDQIKSAYANFDYKSVIVIVLWTIVFFWMLKLGKNSNGRVLNAIMGIAIVVVGFIFLLLKINAMFFNVIPILFVMAYITIFATEVKRDIWNFGEKKKGEINNTDNAGKSGDEKVIIGDIIKAVQNMSKSRIGALIVLANNNFPTSVLASGTRVNAEISSALIESVFFPNSPLHDGAMVINGTHITAAGCFLPLTQETNIPKELGTRHRAGIGITETINATAIIVSEETGIISIAVGGKITRYANTEMLEKTLNDFYWQIKED